MSIFDSLPSKGLGFKNLGVHTYPTVSKLTGVFHQSSCPLRDSPWAFSLSFYLVCDRAISQQILLRDGARIFLGLIHKHVNCHGQLPRQLPWTDTLLGFKAFPISICESLELITLLSTPVSYITLRYSFTVKHTPRNFLPLQFLPLHYRFAVITYCYLK